MKKNFTLLFLFVCSLFIQQAFAGNSYTNPQLTFEAATTGEPGSISIRSDRQSGELQLSFASGKKEKAVIIILDEAGKIVWQQTSRLMNSDNLIRLKNATGLQEGSYTVQLKSKDKTYTTRFMIWK